MNEHFVALLRANGPLAGRGELHLFINGNVKGNTGPTLARSVECWRSLQTKTSSVIKETTRRGQRNLSHREDALRQNRNGSVRRRLVQTLLISTKFSFLWCVRCFRNGIGVALLQTRLEKEEVMSATLILKDDVAPMNS